MEHVRGAIVCHVICGAYQSRRVAGFPRLKSLSTTFPFRPFTYLGINITDNLKHSRASTTNAWKRDLQNKEIPLLSYCNNNMKTESSMAIF